MDKIRVRVKDKDKDVEGLNKDTTVRELINALCMQTKVCGKMFLIKKHGSNETLLHPDRLVWDYHKKKDSKSKYILKIEEVKKEKENLMSDSIKQSPQRKSLPPKLKKSKQKINNSKFDKAIQDHNQNNNNSLSDVRSNTRMRPSSAMTVSSTNKHNSLNRRVADQARHFHRQQIPSNTSSSSLPVAPQKSTSGRGTQEHSSTSSLGKSSSRHRSSSKSRADPADGSSRPRRRRETSESSEVAQYTAASLRRQARSRTPAPGTTSSLSRHQPKRPLSAHGGNRKEMETIVKYKNLVKEQLKTLDEFIKTGRTIEKDLNYYVSLWKNKTDLPRDVKVSNIETEIYLLEQTISNNDAAIKTEQALLDRLNIDEMEVIKVSEEKQKFQNDADEIDHQIDQLKFKTISLNQEISEEKRLQQSKVESKRKAIQNEVEKLKLECDRMKESLDTTQQELQRSEKECEEKALILDSLERELRQQNLMKFVHDNGIKRSDLPSNDNKLEDYIPNKPVGILKPPSHNSMDEVVNSVAKKDGDGGFWV